MPEEEVMKLTQDHVDLTNSTGIKRKEYKGKDATLPTPTQKQKKATINQQDMVGGRGAIKHGTITPGRPTITTPEESL